MTTPKCTVRLEHIEVSRLKLDSVQLWETPVITNVDTPMTAAMIPLVDEITLDVKSNMTAVLRAAIEMQPTMLVAMMPSVDVLTTTPPTSFSIPDAHRWVGGTLSEDAAPVQLLSTQDRTQKQREATIAANRYIQENRVFLRQQAELNSAYEG